MQTDSVRKAQKIENSAQNQALSSSLEDYLETIFNLTAQGDVARSKDIAEAMNVAKSSVTGALRTLADKKLVNYKPYAYITLTKAGRQAAQKVAMKHHILKSFFSDILAVDPAVAQEAACKAEHALGTDIADRLMDFIEFVTHTDNENGYNLADEFRAFCRDKKTRTDSNDQAQTFSENTIPLSKVRAGQTVTLTNIDAGDDLRSRLAAMGMVPNTKITIVSNDRPGPFVVNVKGTKIAIGRTMAHKVMVTSNESQE